MERFCEHVKGFRTGGIEYLRRNVPEVAKVELFPAFSEVELIKGVDLGTMLLLEYSMRAPSLFPAVRQRLLEAGLGKRSNFLDTHIVCRGTPDEIYRLHMGFYGNRLQFGLNVSARE